VSVDLGHDQHVPVSRRFTSAVRAALVQRHRLDREPGRGGARRAEPADAAPEQPADEPAGDAGTAP
jgi:hypothetical protein